MKPIHRLGVVYADLEGWSGRRGCGGYEQRSCRVKRSEHNNATYTKARHSTHPRYQHASTIGPAGFGSDAAPTSWRTAAGKRAAIVVTLF